MTEWVSRARSSPEATPIGGMIILSGWRKVWYGRVVRLPFIFYPIAFLDCSVPGTRGRLGRLLHPSFTPPRGDPPPPLGGVREPRRPAPTAPSTMRATAD